MEIAIGLAVLGVIGIVVAIAKKRSDKRKRFGTLPGSGGGRDVRPN